ncbi:MAG: ankyrin repeat domain-containing protein [Candidatus Thiodiazotropha sp.]
MPTKVTIISLVLFALILGFSLEARLFSPPQETMDICIYSRDGELDRLRLILSNSRQPAKLVNSFDDAGMTPLMLAVKSSDANIEVVRLLLDNGADVNAISHGRYDNGRPVLSYALSAGDPRKAALLLQRGANIRYRRAGGYDAIIDAVHGRDITRDSRLIELLKLLIDHGADVNGRTKYCESGVRVTSSLGRFDAVALLLAAGAEEEPLGWSPLMKAIALGGLEDIKSALKSDTNLEAKDSWKRTPWLLAIQTGDIAKTQLLREQGANTDAHGASGKPPLFYAIGNGHHEMLQWLLDLGMDPEQHDGSGSTALIEAAQYGDTIAMDLLLEKGAEVDRGKFGRSPEYKERLRELFGDRDDDSTSLEDSSLNEETALSYAMTAKAALRLIAAGADPSRLTREARRQILGFKADSSDEYRLVSPKDFLRGRYRRFGRTNPELTNDPFWLAMIRSGANAWSATRYFSDSASEPDKPVWCADRFGQSLTALPDGRIVEIGGEHEDWYDPDFSIYNDVFVHDGRGNIQIYSYPKKEFPPTDFHTATRVDEYIYIIGSLGYADTRSYGMTSVFRLNLDDFHMEAVKTSGEMPGWIYDHRARLITESRILITGGKVCTLEDGEEKHTPNNKDYILDLKKMVWSSSNSKQFQVQHQ